MSTANESESVTSTSRVALNRLAGALVCLLGVYVAVEGANYGPLKAGRPSAGAFPLIVGVGLALLGVSLVVGAEHEATQPGEDSYVPDRRGLRSLLATLAGVVGFMALLGPLGYVGTMSLFLAFLLLVVAGTRKWVAALAAVAFSLGTFYAFSHGLGVPLPRSHLLPLALLGL